MDSILTSIKKMLGIAEEYEHFDADLIMHINSVLSILTQLGIGNPEGFAIYDATALWSDFIPASPKLELIKSYMHMKVKILFDPPTSSSVLESMKRITDELEWRIQVIADPIETAGEEENQNGE